MESPFYMMWVAGKGAPKRIHPTLERAREAVQAYKDDGGTREVFILQVVEQYPGRRLLTLKRRPDSNKVEPKHPTPI
jgi:hypothetical protein